MKVKVINKKMGICVQVLEEVESVKSAYDNQVIVYHKDGSHRFISLNINDVETVEGEQKC